MSRKPAAIPLFADSYLADTTHLSTEEHGAYLLLMMAAWRQEDCTLPLDDKKLARIAKLSPKKWAAIRSTILEFWTVEAGRIFQKRLRQEHRFVRQKSEGNRKSAVARWAQQAIENNESGGCDRIYDRNAPPPLPIEEEDKSSSPPIVPHGGNQPRRTMKAVAPRKYPMPADWTPEPLPPEVQELVDMWPPGRLERETASFRNFWQDDGRTRPGWDRTFHNWIRRLHDQALKEPPRAKQFAPRAEQRSTSEIALDLALAGHGRGHAHRAGGGLFELGAPRVDVGR